LAARFASGEKIAGMRCGHSLGCDLVRMARMQSQPMRNKRVAAARDRDKKKLVSARLPSIRRRGQRQSAREMLTPVHMFDTSGNLV
jgi:hypothetical protein